MTQANGLNITGTGIVGNTGTAFNQTSLTQHNVLVGGSTSSTITNVPPPAPAGIPLVSVASADPAFGTCAIGGGGTNATTYTQTNGIVTYNGTSLVNYAGPQIDSSGRMTNTSQPMFFSYKSSATSNVTGDGTDYTIICNSTHINIGSSYNTGTGVFTAPITGNYVFSGIIDMTSLGVSHTDVLIHYYYNSVQVQVYRASPFTIVSSSGDLVVSWSSGVVPLSASQTAYMALSVAGGTKTVGVNGNGTAVITSFSGYLVG